MIYTHAAAALLGAAIAAVSAWQVQNWRYASQIDALAASYADERTKAEQRARTAEQTITTKYQEALNEARNREALLRTELGQLRTVSDSLRDQAATAARRLADAPPAAVLEYATTVNAVYDDCRRAYEDMAATATGHATDVRAFKDAWPVSR